MFDVFTVSITEKDNGMVSDGIQESKAKFAFS